MAKFMSQKVDTLSDAVKKNVSDSVESLGSVTDKITEKVKIDLSPIAESIEGKRGMDKFKGAASKIAIVNKLSKRAETMRQRAGSGARIMTDFSANLDVSKIGEGMVGGVTKIGGGLATFSDKVDDVIPFKKIIKIYFRSMLHRRVMLFAV